MANDTTRLTIELEVLLRNLSRTLRGLDQVRRRLQSIANVRVGGQSVNKTTLATQKLALQQQRLIVQSQELANRQERARQTADRLALSQQRLTQAQQRGTAATARQADAHVRFFKAVQRASVDANKHVQFFRATEAALKKAPQVDAHVRAFKAIEKSARDADSHVRAFRASEAFLRKSPQLDSHVRAFRAIQKSAQDANAHVRFYRANQEALRRAPQLDSHVRMFRAIELNAKRANRELEQTRRAVERLARAGTGLQQLARGLNSLGAAALRVGGGLRSVGASAAILVTGPLVALGRIASRSAADIDTIRNRLIATEGSLEAANARLAELRRLADQSIGVTRRAAFETFSILSVVGDITENTINRQIQALGRLNAAFTIDDQKQFFRNLVQIFQQNFERQDIKEALGRVPIFEQLLQQAFGTADREKLRELKASGKLTLDTFLSGLAEAVNTDPILANIGESIRVRFEKTFERLTDALEPLGLAILGPLERIIVAVEPLILRIAEAFSSLSPNVQTAIVAVGILVAALGPVLFILGGIASGLGAFATALATLGPIISAIGLPAILAVLTGAAVAVTEITAAIILLGLAWRRNFLNIRKLATDAAAGIVAAFNRIRTILTEATQRILPTLQSITEKVLGAIDAFWTKHGATIVRVIEQTFSIVTGVTETFLSLFTDFVDLVLKLIDKDWRGAWQAFARIVRDGLLELAVLAERLKVLVARALSDLVAFIIDQTPKFILAAQQLTRTFIGTMALEIIAAAPKIRDALFTMLLAAALGVDVVTIAKILASRLGKSIGDILRTAESERPPVTRTGPQVGVDVGGEVFRKRPRRRGLVAEIEEEKEDTRGDSILARALNRLQEARDRLAETRGEIELEQLRSRIEIEFNATKGALERDLDLVEQHYEDRLIAIRQYFKTRSGLEEAQFDADIAREIELTGVLNRELLARKRAIEAEFQTDIDEIGRDPKLQGRAREAAIETAELKKIAELEKAAAEFRKLQEESQGRISELEKDRTRNGENLLRVERLLNEELGKRQAQLTFDLLEVQGRTAEAEAGRLRAQFTDTLKELKIDARSLGKDLQTALSTVDLSVLKQRLDELPEPVRVLIELLDLGIKRAQLVAETARIDRTQSDLQLQSLAIQNKVLDGLLSEKQGREQILALQLRYRAVLLETLNAQLQRAKEIADLDEIQRLREQIQEVERLGTAFDTIGQQVNQDFFGAIEDGFAGFFDNARRGFEGLKDAAVQFGESLLGILNRLAAHALAERFFGDLLKPDATETEGTPGGFFSKLFGLAPKKPLDTAAASATLQTGATAAATTLTTGATAAGTSFGSIVTTSAASFASIVISAASALAAAIGVSSATQAGAGGLGSLISGVAATGLFPAVPGGLYKFVEGGHSEAVLTTDPKHATRQLAILKAFLRETRGLGGRIKGFAAGAFISPHEAESIMFSGLGSPAISPAVNLSDLSIASAPSMMKLRQVLVSQNQLPDWVNSSEGEQVLVDFLYRKGHIIRKLGGK